MPYLYFPSLDVLTLVLQSQTLPGSLQVSPCTAIISATQELFVEILQQLSADILAALEPFGVKVVDKLEQATDRPIETINASCWFQLLPLQRCHTDDNDLPKTIIFRTGAPEKFTALASEMLRLGNDRIGYRHVVIGPGETSSTLMRVIEPPYYTLVDVLDASQVSQGRDVSAYREQAPRVWVRMGYQHPLAGRIDPPAGHWLLIDPPREFHFVKEAAFLDIYQALDVRLPQPALAWQSAEITTNLPVPLRLTATGSASAAELWVVRTGAMQQLEQLVARSDDELIERLAFAVVPNDLVPNAVEPLVILRVRPSRAAPPILILDAAAYCTTMRLPNLFVPVGMRIQPPLRRDAIAKLLASDNRTLTWLEPAESTDTSPRFLPFHPQSIADAAFRPLGDWVEYILDHHAAALDTWTASHRFEFESFVCTEDIREPIEPPPRAPSSFDSPGTAEVGKQTDVAVDKGQAPDERPSLAQFAEEPRHGSTNEFIEQLKQVEAEFVSSPDPLDAPSRIEQWLRLGQLHAHLKHQQDATICWSNLLWYPGQPTELVEQWLQAELRSSGRSRVAVNDIRIIVSQTDSRGRDASLVAAFVQCAAGYSSEHTSLSALAPALTQYFEHQADYLPVRVVWLTALAMHKLVGGDPLGLARVRDRLLERLYEHGLMGEFDIVSFLRGGGQNQSDHHRALRARWRELMAAVNNWLAAPMMPKNQTRVYVKLMFAYCLARMGEVVHGRELLHQATEELDSTELVHLWMGMAFNFRVDQAAQGGNNREALPDDLVRQLEFMEPLDRYKIDRLRSHSRVLEPHERIDPYRHWHRRYQDELFQTLAELKDLLDLKKVETRLRGLLAEHTQGVRGLRVLATALEYAPRLGDEFATQLLTRVDDLLGEGSDVIEKALLLHRAIYVAAHFGHTPRVNSLVVRLGDELPAIVDNYLKLDNQYNPVDKERIETVENLLQHSFRGLRKLGMRNELSTLYGRIAELVDTHDQHSNSSLRRVATPNDASLARRLSLLLSVATGYYYFGNHDDADTTADKVRHVLLEGKLPSVEQRRLAIAYVHCVSLGNPDLALQRMLELFKCLPDGQRLLPKIEDTMTTSSHFSVSELEFVEACLLSLLNDESKWDPQSQLWLDQDEFAIRKKIHADMRLALM